MKPIPISSCHLCDPDSWIVEGDSNHWYECDKCKKIIKKLLKRRNEDESTR